MALLLTLSVNGTRPATYEITANSTREFNERGSAIIRSFAARRGVSVEAVDHDVRKAA